VSCASRKSAPFIQARVKSAPSRWAPGDPRGTTARAVGYLAPDHIGSNGIIQVGTCQSSALQVGTCHLRDIQERPRQVGVCQVCTGEVCTLQIRAPQHPARQVRARQIPRLEGLLAR
jgi:hypothetical protein